MVQNAYEVIYGSLKDGARSLSGPEYVAFEWQAGAASFAGQWRRAQDLARRSIDEVLRSDTKQVAADYLAEAALRGAVFDQCTRSKAAAMQALALEHTPSTTTRAVLALALCGEASQARRPIDELVQGHSKDTRINGIWAPTIRAAIELRPGKSQPAVDLLEGAKRYEAAAQFWPQYVRGQAYLKLGRGAEAGVEFQKISIIGSRASSFIALDLVARFCSRWPISVWRGRRR